MKALTCRGVCAPSYGRVILPSHGASGVNQRSTRVVANPAAGHKLSDVARAAGVSAATVSRFFSAPDKLTGPTRDRVRAAVDQLGYVPNMVAGGLASSRSRLIAVIVPAITHSIFSATIQAMTDALSDAGYSVILGLTGEADEHMNDVLLSVLGRRPDGVILTAAVISPEARRKLKTAGFPVIETWDIPDDPIDRVVGFSHRAVGRRVAEHAIAQGARSALMISASGRRAADRQEGFRAAFEAGGGRPPETIVFGGVTTFGQGREGLARALDAGQRPDVVVCTSDWSAHGVLTEALRRGVKVPGDLRVIGFGDLDFSAETEPSLTTIRIDGGAIAREAVAMLIGPGGGPQVVNIGFDLVKRASG